MREYCIECGHKLGRMFNNWHCYECGLPLCDTCRVTIIQNKTINSADICCCVKCAIEKLELRRDQLLENVYCTKCGKAVSDLKAVYCPYCGESLIRTKPDKRKSNKLGKKNK